MEKPSIELIQTSAHIPALIDHLNNAGTKATLVALPENMYVHNLEQYMAFATHYCARYTTDSINDFTAYGREHRQENSTCFIDADSMSAEVIFDLGDNICPGHKFHRAALKLKKTAAYRAILAHSGEKLSQKAAAEFIQDWHDFITHATTATGDTMTPHQAAAKLLDLTIETARELNSKVDDFGHQMSAMERIEAKNKNAIPAEISFNCYAYRGLPARVFTLRISILTGGDKPQVTFRIMQLEHIEEQMAEELKDILTDQLAESSTFEGLTTYIGTAI